MTERDSIAVTGNLSRRRLLQGGALVGIGAFIAVAVIAILASFLYQRFLAAVATKNNEANTAISPAP